ncbi:MAG TPA: prepilin peptidase [Acidobacteriota bacterium]|jgi:leader peptidase (prepilin peptidase)/N-methyltransferase
MRSHNMFTPVAIFLLGLIIGSFLNVVISRVPVEQSVVTPRSRCPQCSTPIAFYDNIPLLSYALLVGRCRHCKAPISAVYPIVELLTGACFLAAFLKFGMTASFVLNSAFFAALVALVFIDLEHRLLPDVITLPMILGGLLFSYFQDPAIMKSTLLERLFSLQMPWQRIAVHATQSLLGILLGGGSLWLVAFLYLKYRNIEGMGMGDVKLMAAVGAFVGWSYAMLTIFLGSLFGAVISTAYIAWTGKGARYELPFGTFLGLAAIASTLWGNDIILWYLKLTR